MTREKFEAIALKAEELADHRPGLYRFILAAMAVTAYLYIFLILAVLIGLLSGLLYLLFHMEHVHGGVIKLAIILLVPIWLILRALWVKIDPPGGYKLKREDCPGLFDLAEEVRLASNAPKVKEIILQYDLNACVAQVPRLGLLGWYKNYLAIGLPLLQTLSPAQFKSVLAHEFGHLSGSHGKFGVWIYRLRQTWNQLLESLASNGSKMTYVFLPLYKLLIPTFSAFSLVQGRQHEFQADTSAAKVAGIENTVTALVRIMLASETIDRKFWQDIYKLADKEGKLPSPFTMLTSSPAPHLCDHETIEWHISRALSTQKEGDNTHPPLAARIGNLHGSKTPFSPTRAQELLNCAMVPVQTAAEFYLGANLQRMAGALDKMWQTSVEPAWAAHKEERQEHSKVLADLDKKTETGSLAPNEAFNHAWLTEEIRGVDAALPLYQSLLAAEPAKPELMFSVGRILLDQKDASGHAMLEEAMAKDPECRSTGCQILAKYYYEIGNLEESKRWRFKAEDSYGKEFEIEQEKNNLTVKDKFLPHDLNTRIIAEINKQMSSLNFKGQVYLVRKQLKTITEKTILLILLVREIPWWHREDSAANEAQEQQLVEDVVKKLAPLSLEFRLFYLKKSPLLKHVTKIPGSRIYNTR